MAVVVLFVACGLHGCSSLTAVPSDTFYRLPCPTGAAPLGAPLAADAIFVPVFDASGIHKERALVYSDAAGVSLKQQRHHFWVESPPQLLQDCLVSYLRGVGAAPLVVRDRRTLADLTVAGRVLQFERVAAAGGMMGRLAVEISIWRRDEPRPRMLRVYRKEITAADPGAEQSVAALATAVADVYRDFLDDAVAALRDTP